MSIGYKMYFMFFLLIKISASELSRNTGLLKAFFYKNEEFSPLKMDKSISMKAAIQTIRRENRLKK